MKTRDNDRQQALASLYAWLDGNEISAKPDPVAQAWLARFLGAAGREPIGWTRQETIEHRAEWNSAVRGLRRHARLGPIEERLGYTRADLQAALQRWKIR